MSASVTLLGKLHEQLAPRLCEALERERETGVKMNPALMRVLVNFLKDQAGWLADDTNTADATSSAAATTP